MPEKKTKPKGKGKKNSVQDQASVRKVLYPEYTSEAYFGENAMRVERAMELLGWKEVDPSKGEEYHFKDLQEKHIFCTNNIKNRPIRWSKVRELSFVHLNKQWEYNGDNLVIGATGLTLNCQHRLISFVFAEQERVHGKQHLHWETIWGSDPITMECSVVFGVHETDKVIMTMDTGNQRTFSDNLYTSPVFKDLKDEQRKKAAQMAEHTVRYLWARTGAKADSFAPYFNHSEASSFLDRHPHIVAAVRHILDCNPVPKDRSAKKGPISLLMHPGYAAGMMYLMGCCDSNIDEYSKALIPDRNEDELDWSYWSDAEKFWALLAKTSAKAANELEPVRRALLTTGDPQTGKTGSRKDLGIVICKAWPRYVNNEELKEGELKPKYQLNKDQELELVDTARTFGGIDLGDNPKVQSQGVNVRGDDDDEDDPDEAPVAVAQEDEGEPEPAAEEGDLPSDDEEVDGEIPSDEEIQAAIAEERAKKEERKKGSGRKKK